MARFYPPSGSANNDAVLDDQVYVDATGLAPRFASQNVTITAYWPWVAWGGGDPQWPAGEQMARGTLWIPPVRVRAALRDTYGARLSYDTGAGYQHWEIISVHSWYRGGASAEEACQYIARLYLGVPFPPPPVLPLGALVLANGAGGFTSSPGLRSDSAAKLILGSAGSLTGTLRFENATNGAIELVPPGGALGAQTLVLPAATDVLVARGTVDTLVNKTLTSPVLNGGALSSLTSLGLLSASPPHNLFFAAGGAQTADRTVTVRLSDGDRSFLLGGDVATGGDLVTSGGAVTFSLSGTTVSVLPVGTHTLVGRDTTDILTNKTLTSPTVQGGTAQGLTQLGLRSSGTGAFDVAFANTENLTAQRTLTLALGDSDRQVSLGGDLATAGSVTFSGAHTLTLLVSANSTVALPTSGTLLSDATAVNQGSGVSITSVGALAATGNSQGTAAAIVTDNVQVSGADGTKGVILPAAVGARVLVENSSASQILKVYPDTGSKISGAATNAAASLGGSVKQLFLKVSSTQWWVLSPV